MSIPGCAIGPRALPAFDATHRRPRRYNSSIRIAIRPIITRARFSCHHRFLPCPSAFLLSLSLPPLPFLPSSFTTPRSSAFAVWINVYDRHGVQPEKRDIFRLFRAKSPPFESRRKLKLGLSNFPRTCWGKREFGYFINHRAMKFDFSTSARLLDRLTISWRNWEKNAFRM